jgi:SAM-dependent methyltransferase
MSTEDAEAYTEHWGPVLRPAVDRLLDELAPLAALSRHSDGRPPRLLDLGTGTGQLAFAALERRPGIEVVGIDRDAAMLEVARRRSAQIAMSASLSLVEGGAQELPFEDAAFDLVASSFVIDDARSVKCGASCARAAPSARLPGSPRGPTSRHGGLSSTLSLTSPRPRDRSGRPVARGRDDSAPPRRIQSGLPRAWRARTPLVGRRFSCVRGGVRLALGSRGHEAWGATKAHEIDASRT